MTERDSHPNWPAVAHLFTSASLSLGRLTRPLPSQQTCIAHASYDWTINHIACVFRHCQPRRGRWITFTIAMDPPLSPLANATSFLPSPADLLLAVPRLLIKAGALGEHFDSVFGKIRSGGSIIAEPTTANLTNTTAATTAARFIQQSATAVAREIPAIQDEMSFFQAMKNVGSVFTYMTSKWAIATFTIVSIFFNLACKNHALTKKLRQSSSTVPISTPRVVCLSPWTDSTCVLLYTSSPCSYSHTAYRVYSKQSGARRIQTGPICNTAPREGN